MKAILFLISVLSLQAFQVSPFMVDGPSMEPSFFNGEIFFIDDRRTVADSLKRGDVVVFSKQDDRDYFFVKRVIGLPGEKISLRKDGIYLNGVDTLSFKLEEPYLKTGTDSTVATEAYRDNYEHVYVVPADKYFVLGDNRSQSLDSRYFKDPFISKADIKGKYLFNLMKI